MPNLATILSVVALVTGAAAASPANSRPPRQGNAAFARGNYVQAARLLAPIAWRGNP
jgi:hypothetical protein